jgi:CheY-like chemotaxis protein
VRQLVKVLVVDDEEDIRYLVRSLLETRGIEVVEAESGEECLQILEKFAPDLILLDVMMPGIDGWEVLRRIRGHDGYKSIPVAMLTSIDPTVDDMMRSEFDTLVDYILKPSLHESLLAKVRSYQKPIIEVKM